MRQCLQGLVGWAAIALTATPSMAFLGFGKYASKREAARACGEWVSKGPKYYEKQDPMTAWRFRREQESKKLGSSAEDYRPSYNYGEIRYPEMNMIRNGDVVSKYIHHGRKSEFEKDTRQNLGFEPESN